MGKHDSTAFSVTSYPDVIDHHRHVAEDMLEQMLQVVRKSCIADKRLLRQHVRLPWLQILDGLIVIARCYQELNSMDFIGQSLCDGHLKIWRKFGLRLGLSEDEIRDEQASNCRVELVRGIVGCSWHRCPLFEEADLVFGRDPLCCSHCRMVRSTIMRVPSPLYLLQPSGPILQSTLSKPVSYCFA